MVEVESGHAHNSTADQTQDTGEQNGMAFFTGHTSNLLFRRKVYKNCFKDRKKIRSSINCYKFRFINEGKYGTITLKRRKQAFLKEENRTKNLPNFYTYKSRYFVRILF